MGALRPAAWRPEARQQVLFSRPEGPGSSSQHPPKLHQCAQLRTQELVEGQTLAEMVGAGWRPSEQEAERIAAELLQTLEYLRTRQAVHGWA